MVISCVTVILSFSLSVHALQFGTNIDGVKTMKEKGADIAYGQIWIGSWNEQYGWGGLKESLQKAKENDVVPVILWYYWGGDISPSCVSHGCQAKDVHEWNSLAQEAAEVIGREMIGREVVLVLEPEFNKNGIENDRAFDRLLVDQTQIFRRAIPDVKIVVGFGSWNRAGWANFPEIIGEADYVGFQMLKSSVRNREDYESSAGELLDSARYVRLHFGKPSFITDVGLSSYPEPAYLSLQANTLGMIMQEKDALSSADVVGLVYRATVDDPSMPLEEYHKDAERHWGLMRVDGTEKPALDVFIDGTNS